MSYVLGVILGLSLINTIFLVNNLKTNTENKKQLDNLYNFTIRNIELTNYTIDKNKKSIEINDNQDKSDNQDKNDNNQSIRNPNELTNSVSQGFSQWSFLNLGKTLKQKSNNSVSSLSKKE